MGISATRFEGGGGVLSRIVGGNFIVVISLGLLFVFWNTVGKDFLLTWREKRRRTTTKGAYCVNGGGINQVES